MVRMLKWAEMRRAFILGMAFNLLGLGLSPLYACASFSSIMAQCGTSKAQSCCKKMHVGQSSVTLAAIMDMSCCYASAPLPQSQYKASDLAPAATPVVTTEKSSPLPRIDAEIPADAARDYSPPSFQSLLCTFLI